MPENDLLTGLKELFPSQDLGTSARSRSGARQIRGRREPEILETNYLPLMAVLLGGTILAVAFLKPSLEKSAGVLQGLNRQQPQVPEESQNLQMQSWQQQDESSQNPWGME